MAIFMHAHFAIDFSSGSACWQDGRQRSERMLQADDGAPANEIAAPLPKPEKAVL
jgi:hypothetical protein